VSIRPAPAAITAAALTSAVLAAATSGPLIAYAAAPALAVAFWRNAFSVALLVPAATATRRVELRHLTSRSGRPALLVCVLAGIALAGHFATWVPAAKLTTVTAATAMVDTQPIWQGLIAARQGRPARRLAWVGIGLAVAGAVSAAGVDVTVSGRAFLGDLLALAGGIAGAAYTAYGERARASVSTTGYTAVCYTVCTLVLAAVCVVGGVPLHGYRATAWIALLAMTLGPQLLGHSMANYALRRVSATTVAVLLLLETPGAAAISWLWLGQVPRLAQVPGLVLLLCGIACVILSAGRSAGGTTAPAAEASLQTDGGIPL
jgi:drug/metabolite transporter (DMT)-like permease